MIEEGGIEVAPSKEMDQTLFISPQGKLTVRKFLSGGARSHMGAIFSSMKKS